MIDPRESRGCSVPGSRRIGLFGRDLLQGSYPCLYWFTRAALCPAGSIAPTSTTCQEMALTSHYVQVLHSYSNIEQRTHTKTHTDIIIYIYIFWHRIDHWIEGRGNEPCHPTVGQRVKYWSTNPYKHVMYVRKGGTTTETRSLNKDRK